MCIRDRFEGEAHSGSTDPEVTRNRIGGRCARCNTWVFPDHGRVLPYGTGERVVCEPACATDPAPTNTVAENRR